MIKQTLILLFLLSNSVLFGQKPAYLFSIQPYEGCEINMLKSPGKYTSSNGTIFSNGDLWKNAPFLGIKTRYLAYTKKKTHLYELKGNFRKALFTSQLLMTASDFGITGSYRYKNHKKITNLLKFNVRNYVKTGQDQDNLIGAPLQYKRFGLSDELNIKLKKKWLFTTTPFSTTKIYSNVNYNRFMYVDNGIKTSLAYRYKFKKKVGYAMDLGFHQRNYFINKINTEIEEEPEVIDLEELEELDELEDLEELEEEQEFEEEENETENRIWRYYSIGVRNKIPLGSRLKLTTRIAFTNRADILQESFGYNQYLFELGLAFKGTKWKTAITTSTYSRNYTAVTFGDEQSENEEEEYLLKYQYIKYSGNVKYRLNNQLDLIFRTMGKARISNANDINKRTMRSYFTTEFTAGIIWTIKKDFKQRKAKPSFSNN